MRDGTTLMQISCAMRVFAEQGFDGAIVVRHDWSMLTRYIEAAMRLAHYEIMEDGRFWGDIPPAPGVWADGDTLEQCREELQSVVEDWILISARLGHEIPVIDGIDLNPKPQDAETLLAA